MDGAINFSAKHFRSRISAGAAKGERKKESEREKGQREVFETN